MISGSPVIRVVFLALAFGAALTSSGSAPAAEPDGGAAPTNLRVTNLGQPGMVSEPPQMALDVASRGDCAAVLTAEHVDQGSSPCTPGTWPANGSGAWGPRLNVAAGDTIALEFSTPVTAVGYSALTDAPPGGHVAPDGSRAPNRQLLGPADAVSDSDGKRWLITLPNPVDPLVRTGANFSVVATTGSASSDFAFSLDSPRAASYGGECGLAWYAPGDETSTCPQAPPGLPPGPTGGPDDDAPAGGDPQVERDRPSAGKIRRRLVTLRHKRVRVRIVAPDANTVRIRIRYRGTFAGSARAEAGKVLRVRLRRHFRRALHDTGSITTNARILTCRAGACRRVTRRLEVRVTDSTRR